jgi:hypothetical protein
MRNFGNYTNVLNGRVACPEPEAGCMSTLNERAGGLPRHCHGGISVSPVRYLIVIVPPKG